MTIFEKICQGGYLLVINPRLFLKYLNSNIKRLTPRWKYFKPKSNLKKINGVVFEIDFDYFSWNIFAKQMYFDCYEIAVAEMIKKTLKPGDIFFDVGANIGYFTAIGASLVGLTGQVHSFEPALQSFFRLKKIAEMNPDYKIILNNCALAEKSGTAKMDFAEPPHSGGSTMLLGILSPKTPKKTIAVQTIRLDRYLKEKKIENISLIKIDVEGYEFPVLQGLQNYFENSKNRPVIICEIAPSVYPVWGYTLNQLSIYLRKYGYEAYNIMNPELKIDITKFKKRAIDVIFKTKKS